MMTVSQQLRCVALGAIFWFSGAMLVRLLGDSVFVDGSPLLFLMFAVTFPVTYGFVWVCMKTIGVASAQMQRPMAIMTLTATLLDGIALTWFRGLYAENDHVAVLGAALILWGAGVGLLMAEWLASRQTR